MNDEALETRDRTILMLQGPMSFFFTYLGEALRKRGAQTRRILFCPGDRLFHRGPNAAAYRGTPADWPGFIVDYIDREGVTDLICLGDGRRWHEDAIAVSAKAGVRIHVIEQGYLRPHFLTLEPDGTGGRSRFPQDWPAIERIASGGSDVAPFASFQTSFARYAAMDVGFNLANLIASWVLFPHYRRHSIDHPIAEWAGWIWNKALSSRSRLTERKISETRIAEHDGPVFVHPLQLDTDYQIRLHAPPGGVQSAMERVVNSFSTHAPDDALLVVKIHPLDHGWANWRRKLSEIASAAGCGDRCVYLDGGDLDELMTGVAGVVVVNSTVGLSALRVGAPVKALGKAIYDLQGLTVQGDLDSFWRIPKPPEPDRLATFVSALLNSIQTPGGFDGAGAKVGAENVADMVLAPPPY